MSNLNVKVQDPPTHRVILTLNVGIFDMWVAPSIKHFYNGTFFQMGLSSKRKSTTLVDKRLGGWGANLNSIAPITVTRRVWTPSLRLQRERPRLVKTLLVSSASVNDEVRETAWKSYEKLLNPASSWDKEFVWGYYLTCLLLLDIMRCSERERKSVSKMKNGKAAGSSELVWEIVKSAGQAGIDMITEQKGAQHFCHLL